MLACILLFVGWAAFFDQDDSENNFMFFVSIKAMTNSLAWAANILRLNGDKIFLTKATILLLTKSIGLCQVFGGIALMLESPVA